MQRMREAAEKAKIELSTVLDTELNLPFLTADANGPKHFTHKLTRAKLEQIIEPIIKRCKHPIEQAINDAKLSFKDIEKIIMVGGPTRMPIVQKFVEDATGKKVERGVDLMECVALGASIQAGVLAGEVKDVLLLDVTPLSLGIETLGGVCTKLIERNATIPTKKSQIFSTAADSQNAVTIHVLQGERPMATDNKSLGRFDLIGIPPAPRGIPQIEVSFDIDANGIVHVAAKDLGTGKEQSIKITATQKLNDEEIQRMKKEAEVHAEDDKKRKEEAETINEADTLVYTAEKLFDDMKGKVKDENIDKVKADVEELKKLLQEEKRDVSKIKSKLDEVNKKIQELSTELYQKVAEEQAKKEGKEQGAASEETDTEAKDDNVMDAEFTEKSNETSEGKTSPKKKSKKL